MSGLVLLTLRLLMTIVLYAFLGWALYLLWRDLQRQGELLAAQQAPPLALQPRGGEAASGLLPHTFTQPDALIGRDPACDLTLDDKTVSARHARLRYHHSQWWLEDLGSTNGTFLNEEPVKAPVVLTGGDVVRFGSLAMEVKEGDV
jgi:hypothetical protein